MEVRREEEGEGAEEEGGCGAWRGRGRKEESCRWLTIWLLRSGPAAVPTSPCHADVLSSAGPGRGSRVRGQTPEVPLKPVAAASLLWGLHLDRCLTGWQVLASDQGVRGSKVIPDLRAPITIPGLTEVGAQLQGREGRTQACLHVSGRPGRDRVVQIHEVQLADIVFCSLLRAWIMRTHVCLCI